MTISNDLNDADDLTQLREDCAAQIRSHQDFSGVEVFTEKLEDIESKIEMALGSLKGVCIIVLTPYANVSFPDSPGPMFDDVTIIVRVTELPMINNSATGTKKPASCWALLVANQATGLHLFQTSRNKTITCRQIKIVPDPNGLVIYDVVFKTSL